jgi:N6-adenosine-specific RNA methylase IME4
MKKYNVIYADPAWKYSNTVYQDNGRKGRDLKDQYPTMSISEIKNLPIEEIANNDCALFMCSSGFEILHLT